MLDFGKIKDGSKIKGIVVMDYHKGVLLIFQNFGSSIVIYCNSYKNKRDVTSISITAEDGITLRALISGNSKLFESTPIIISENDSDMIISIPSKENFCIICKEVEKDLFDGFSEFIENAAKSMPEIKEKTIIDFCERNSTGVQMKMTPGAQAENK